MGRKIVIAGVLYLASVAAAGVLDTRNEEGKGKEPEKKPNIVKDYVCLRDGELCHPDFARNRGLYVSCSNGVAWEQQCPRCSYHPLNCPTRTLWFDGEKCEWASPKLASSHCQDRIFLPELQELKSNVEKENAFSEQESLLQNLQVAPMAIQQQDNSPLNLPVDTSKWQVSPMSVAVPMYYKSPKYEEIVREPAQEIDDNDGSQDKEVKAVSQDDSAADDADDASQEDSSDKIERKSGEDGESESPSFLTAEVVGSKIVKLNDPVYALVNNPDGSGKQVLMRISQPFILEDQSRSALPSLHDLSSYEKEMYISI